MQSCWPPKYLAVCTIFKGETSLRFFTYYNHESFPVYFGLVDWQCKSISMLPQKFSSEYPFSTLIVKVFTLQYFAVHGMLLTVG